MEDLKIYDKVIKEKRKKKKKRSKNELSAHARKDKKSEHGLHLRQGDEWEDVDSDCKLQYIILYFIHSFF